MKKRILITGGTGFQGPSGPNANQSLNTSNDVRFDSLGVGTNASGTTGEIRATNDITAYYSDARLKTIDGKIENALDLIDKINGYYFYENETAKQLGYNNDKRMVGVIAQEVNEILPEVIAEAPISSEYMTVKYDKLVPLLINAIKELKEKLNHKNCNCDGTT